MTLKFFEVAILALVLLALIQPSFCDLANDCKLIYIRADGKVDPPEALIRKVDDSTYELEDNIFGNVVEKSNIVIEGRNFSINGGGEGLGLSSFGVTNLTVKELDFQNFEAAAFLFSSFHFSFFRCTFEKSLFGLKFDSSANINITDCYILDNGFGLVFQNCSGINVCGNLIQNNSYHGIF